MKDTPMHRPVQSEFVAALLASSLEGKVDRDHAPLQPIHTPRLARALGFYRDTLGFEVAACIPHVAAVLQRGATELVLMQVGAAPGRFERPERPCEGRPFEPGTCRIATGQLHKLFRLLRPGLVRSSQAAAGVVWQPWRAWELDFVDGDGNHVIFMQPGSTRDDRGQEAGP